MCIQKLIVSYLHEWLTFDRSVKRYEWMQMLIGTDIADAPTSGRLN
jgi:hypothetical protein